MSVVLHRFITQILPIQILSILIKQRYQLYQWVIPEKIHTFPRTKFLPSRKGHPKGRGKGNHVRCGNKFVQAYEDKLYNMATNPGTVLQVVCNFNMLYIGCQYQVIKKVVAFYRMK